MFSEVVTTLRNAKLFKDGNKRHLSSCLSQIFHESVLDSGDFNTQIDMTVTLDASGKSYSIISNGWHFKIWTAQEGQTPIGTIGYGGRQGASWVYTRLDGLWGFDSNNSNLQPLQPDNLPPVYDVNKFYINQSSLTLGPLNDKINHKASVGWTDVWPGIDLRLKATGEGLKIELVLSDAARNVVMANAAATSLNFATTIIGPRLNTDFGNVPAIKNGAGQQSWPGAFDDSDGLGLTLEDASANLIAFMPLDVCYIEKDVDGNKIPISTRKLNPDKYSQKLIKRLWKAGPNYYILSGLNANAINSMAAGEIVFDPTFNQTVSNANDGDDDGSTWYSGGSYAGTVSNFSGTTGGFRFTGLAAGSISQGQTFDTATIKLTPTDSFSTTVGDLNGDDADTSAAFTTAARPSLRTLTTAATVCGSAQMPVVGTQYTFSIVGIADEVIGRAGWTDNLSLIWSFVSGGGDIAVEDSSNAGTDEAILDLSWTSGITGSGSLQASPATIAGVGKRIITGTGALQAGPATISGTGSVSGSVTGSGSLQASPATITGVGKRIVTGAGAVQAVPATIAGVGKRVITGSGTLQADPAIISGVGSVSGSVAGSGSLQAGLATIAGVGKRIVKGSGNLEASPATVSGEGSVSGLVSGSGALQAGLATVAGVGKRVVTGSGVLQASPATLSGLGDINVIYINQYHVIDLPLKTEHVINLSLSTEHVVNLTLSNDPTAAN